MEFYEKTLENLIFSLKNEPMKTRLELCKNLAIALKYIHSLGIIHRDLKTSNILIKNGQIKLADFGLSTFLNNKKFEAGIGTENYSSPEQMNSNFYNEKTDIFSLGLIFYEILQPYKCVMKKIENFNLLKKFNKIPNEKFQNDFLFLCDVILNMIQKDFNSRPDENEIINAIEFEINKINSNESFFKKKNRKISEDDFSLNTMSKFNESFQENNKSNFSCADIQENINNNNNEEFVLYFEDLNEKEDLLFYENNNNSNDNNNNDF